MGKTKKFNNFKQPAQSAKKKTAKVVHLEVENLASFTRNQMIQMQGMGMQQDRRLTIMERQSVHVDFRSLATLRLLVAKGIFSDAEHDAMAEVVQIENFQEQSDRENAQKFLKPVPPTQGLEKGLTYTFSVTASEDSPGNSDHPAGRITIPQLSVLRGKMEFDSKEFPTEIEQHLLGAVAGETRAFTENCPAQMGSFSGKPVNFEFTILEVLKADPPPVDKAPGLSLVPSLATEKSFEADPTPDEKPN